MAKDNSTFFDKKQEWSKIKDSLLSSYLLPYFQKIVYTWRPVFYIDCFAGMGIFKDGQPGSPMIALNKRNEVLARASNIEAKIDMCFIENNYESELRQNMITKYPAQDNYGSKTVIGGKYEDKILDLLEAHKGYNVFLYIDPYGIKSLDYGLFTRFLDFHPPSFEMLINMNSFGFIRAACRAMNIPCDDIDVHDFIEYNSTEFDSSPKSIELLDRIAGGKYWREIVRKYRQEKAYNKNACFDAENEFSRSYKRCLRKIFTYVLDMPMRLKVGGPPKYRLVYVTKHPDGCILMADNMMKRARELLVTIQSKMQLELFDQDVDNNIVDSGNIYSRVKNRISLLQGEIRLHAFMATFFTEEGIVCGIADIKKALKRLEVEKYIDISRNPAMIRNGCPSHFLDESKGRTVIIRKRQYE